jgi:hypothetical protein
MTDSPLNCPQCNNIGATKVNFTFWGGLIGPKIMKQVRCIACGQNFNGQTGKPITAGTIIGYSAAILGICIIPIMMIFLVI